MTARGYASLESIQDELAVVLTGAQMIHADRLLAEAEDIIDGVCGRGWLGTSPVTELINSVGGVLRLRNTPITGVTAITARYLYPGGGLTDPQTISSDNWRVLDLARGLVAAPLDGHYASVTYTHGGLPVPPRVSRAARLLVAYWMQPAMTGVSDDVQSYQIGPALRVTRFDRNQQTAARQAGGIPSNILTLLDDFEGSWVV